jgi:hypothetical protein
MGARMTGVIPSPFDCQSANGAIAVWDRSSTDELGVDSYRW